MFELQFLLLVNREPPDLLELLHRGGGRCPLVNLPLSGLLLPRRGCGSGGCQPLFLESAKEKLERAHHLLKMQNQWGSHALVRTHRSHPRKNVVKLRMLCGSCHSHGGEPEPGLFGSACPAFCPPDPTSVPSQRAQSWGSR